MVDACGWEIIKNDPFLQEIAPHRHKLESVFGYSSTCVPSIVSGHWPDEHRNWCYFVHSPETSPFKFLSWLKWLPKAVTSRRIFRRWLTKLAKKKLGFKGYFDLYNIPFEHIDRFDFTEKKSPLQPKGMNRGTNIFDTLQEKEVPHFVSDPNQSEEANRDALAAHIEASDIDFAFMYWAGLDGLLHRVGNDSPEVPAKLRVYEEWIHYLYDLASKSYEEVNLYVFSDHGMANCDVHLDLKSVIETLPLTFGKDYAVVYDSTMARFWFFNDEVRQKITAALQTVPQGRIMPEAELKELRVHFEDHQFGELIFLVQEGVLIVPSHMGERPIRAMHGYHPHDAHSYASLLTNRPELTSEVTHIPHIHRLMEDSIEQQSSSYESHVCHRSAFTLAA
ncbi:Predicted pyrophosphatase or phosphodiesterase, AlkP superfamily [Prosthecobacter debontii]|uniref:Predicted pyrophosphatase or phosphodiesterase, AlkP superfamily n=2 Tax=Prosthecobacter debontii TaxID=48467 RepID=A0A1T4XW17_9BACT|nr:Predicted pyrophosphatase or phosphodiesterase, AlkP superfamily [Prosthecobacter debontii]